MKKKTDVWHYFEFETNCPPADTIFGFLCVHRPQFSMLSASVVVATVAGDSGGGTVAFTIRYTVLRCFGYSF